MRSTWSPNGLKPATPLSVSGGDEAQLLADRDTLRELLTGLDRLEARLEQTLVIAAAAQRNYFSPDEDDRVRQAVLAYRNYRLATYEIICRYRDFERIADQSLRVRCFLIAFAAALALYTKSLKIIQVAESQPLLRSKINEADAKFDLPSGFFDDVLVGYSSLSNYRAVGRADQFWRRERGSELVRRLDGDPEWRWVCDTIRHKRTVVRQRFFDVLRRRLRHDWRAFWKMALRPLRQTSYELQCLLGGRFAGVYIVSNPIHVLTPEVLGGLRSGLQPGDVLLCRAEGKLTAALVPGFWSHAAIYLGERAELEALKVREHPHAAARWGQIPENAGPLGCVIEGVAPRVRVCPLETSLQADHLLVLRPNLPEKDIASALGEAFGHLGKPYDFEFDFNVSSRIVCTELVYRCYHGRGLIQFPLVKRMGRFTLTADDMVHLALDELEKAGGAGHAPFRPVALILKRRDGQAHAVPPSRIVSLLRRVRRGWRPVRRSPAPSVPAPIG